MNPAEIERVVGAITEKDVMAFALEKIWDQDVAVSALGSIEGVSSLLSTLVFECVLIKRSCWTTNVSAVTPAVTFKG